MDNKTVRLRGVEELGKQELPRHESKLLAVTPKGRVRLGSARDAGGVVELKDMAADDLVCVHYSNGFRFWTRVDDLHRAHPAAGLSRSARGVADADAEVWEIDPGADSQGAQRGAAKVAVEALEFFGIDLKGAAAEKITSWYEDRKLKSVGKKSGLYRCAIESDLALSASGNSLPNDQPLLVFIHGTGSNTEGGFGKLKEAGNRRGAELRERLHATYADQLPGCGQSRMQPERKRLRA